MEDHGGAVGEGTLGRSCTRSSAASASTSLVLALLAGGLLLVTGSSLGLWARRSRDGRDAGRARGAGPGAEPGERRRGGRARRRSIRPTTSTAVIDPRPGGDVSFAPASPPVYVPPSTPSSPDGPHLIDGVHDAPEIFGGPARRAVTSQPVAGARSVDADDGTSR